MTMENLANEPVEEGAYKKASSSKQFRNLKLGIVGIVAAGVISFGGIFYYQANHFNSHIVINGIKVGGLTAEKALKKLKSSKLGNKVYVGQELILNGADTKMAFTNDDMPGVQDILRLQRTFLPSAKTKNYELIPRGGDQYRSKTMKAVLKEKLTSKNESLKVPQNAQIRLEQGKMVVTKSVSGNQYDVTSLMKAYQSEDYKSNVHLKPVYIQPIKEDNRIIKKEKQILQDFLQRTIDYRVQNHDYSLKASDLIQNATVSKDGQIAIDSSGIQKKLASINNSQGTLNKNFVFKTHSGTVIIVKGQGYGWALDVNKEAKQIEEAFEKNQTSVAASNVYGHGWGNSGIGFQNTTNNGIGDTYAEVSIQAQRIWLYRNGQMVLTTNVVTGRHDVGEDTPKGVWYILYKHSPDILVGTEVGNINYRVPVAYWAPFTNSGCGFHDATWRANWSGTAYLHQGSGGCVNTPTSVMKTVYNDLSVYEPVIVY